MVECFEDMNSTASLPNGLLISKIIVDSLVDLSNYKSTFIVAMYDTPTISSMDYVFINKKWYQKKFVQSRAETPRDTRISVESTTLLLKEAAHIRISLDGLESYMQVLEDTLGKVLQLHKDSNIDIEKIHLEMGGLKKDASRYINTILKEVNSIKTGADSYKNQLAVTMNTLYFSFSKTVEKSLTTFYTKVVNTLTYFLVKH